MLLLCELERRVEGRGEWKHAVTATGITMRKLADRASFFDTRLSLCVLPK